MSKENIEFILQIPLSNQEFNQKIIQSGATIRITNMEKSKFYMFFELALAVIGTELHYFPFLLKSKRKYFSGWCAKGPHNKWHCKWGPTARVIY